MPSRIEQLFAPAGGCFVVADVAQAHDGSLGMAHAFIDAAAGAGADAIKFQTHIAEAESTPAERFRVAFSRQDATRYDYWKRMEFTPAQWQGLADHAAGRGLVFLSTPFSLEAIDLLERVGVPAWKIGAGETGNTVFLDRMLATRKPMLVSSGMSDWAELDACVNRIKQAGVPLLVFQCTTKYPCPPAEVGLPLIGRIAARYGVPAGLSDHSGLPCFGIAAAALGARAVEVHLAMSRHCFGPDVPASLTPEELRAMVAGVRAVTASLQHDLDKDRMASELREVKQLFARSIVTTAPLAAGAPFTAASVALKKPGGGLGVALWDRVLRARAARDLPAGTFLKESDLADA